MTAIIATYNKKWLPEGELFLLAPAEYVGANPARQDIAVLEGDNPRELRLGWSVREEIGIMVINDFALARVDLTVKHYVYRYPEAENDSNNRQGRHIRK